MKISIDSNPVVCEILSAELWKELQTQLAESDFHIEKLDTETDNKKGFGEDICIAVLSSLAAEKIGEIISAFTRRHKVKITIYESDSKKIEVSCYGDDYKKLEKFLMECIK